MGDLTEQQARQMEAGSELGPVCERWMFGKEDHHQMLPPWPQYSTDWSAAGPLLEAMKGHLSYRTIDGQWMCIVGAKGVTVRGYAPTAQLAIARACAVLVARGISRDDLRDT